MPPTPVHPGDKPDLRTRQDRTPRPKDHGLRSLNRDMQALATAWGHQPGPHLLFPSVVAAAAAADAGLALPPEVSLPNDPQQVIDLKWKQGHAEYLACRKAIEGARSNVTAVLLNGMVWYVRSGGDLLSMLKESKGRFYLLIPDPMPPGAIH